MLWLSLHASDSLDAFVLGWSNHETIRLRQAILIEDLDLLLRPLDQQAVVESPAPQQHDSDLCESGVSMCNSHS